ncbi:hypothetical protein ACJX0J_032705, partial [Zea mays]
MRGRENNLMVKVNGKYEQSQLIVDNRFKLDLRAYTVFVLYSTTSCFGVMLSGLDLLLTSG